ncbi:MAG: helix-turn-helix domain-containing protein [Candidatus Thorarchaeota archaeon]
MTNLGKENRSEYTFNDYLESIDYVSSPMEELTREVINERLYQRLSQKQLARKIGTKQSVVSRFENFGRSPSLKWLVRLAEGLGVRFRATIHGNYMFVVPRKYRAVLDARAKKLEIRVAKLLEGDLTEYCEEKYQSISWNPVVSTHIDEYYVASTYKSYFLESTYYEVKPVKSPIIEEEQLVS